MQGGGGLHATTALASDLTSPQIPSGPSSHQCLAHRERHGLGMGRGIHEDRPWPCEPGLWALCALPASLEAGNGIVLQGSGRDNFPLLKNFTGIAVQKAFSFKRMPVPGRMGW